MKQPGQKLGMVLLAVVLSTVAGCVNVSDVRVDGRWSCKGAFIKTELFFGRCRPDGGVVSEEEWDRFVDEHITPRFEEGLTIVDADGRWKNETGEIISEKTKIVILLHKGGEEDDGSIEYIRDKYKQLFEQESVLRVDTCAEAVY